MLDRRGSDFAEAVWASAARLGRNAPRIADDIINALFPRTVEEAGYEGAHAMLRDGVIGATKRVLRQAPNEDQYDFSDIDSRFREAASKLHSKSYYVEVLNEYVTVPRLISEPKLLNGARRFMRRKGLENIAEADRLDSLYEVVTAGPRLDL